MAGQAIRRGEALLHVPERLLITPEAGLRHSSVAALLDHAALPAWSVLAALLAELKIGQTGPESTWGPYISALPLQTGCVLEWSADEVRVCFIKKCALSEQLVRLTGGTQGQHTMRCHALQSRCRPAMPHTYMLPSLGKVSVYTLRLQVAMLQGTSLQKAATDITSASDVSWEELQPVLTDGCAQGLIPRDLLDRQLFTWSFSTLLSRLVKLPGSGGADVCVPWADMLNHSPHVSAFFAYDQSTQSVILRPDKSYKKGEQVICADAPDQHRLHSMLLLCVVKIPGGWVNVCVPWVNTFQHGNISEATLSAPNGIKPFILPLRPPEGRAGVHSYAACVVAEAAFHHYWHPGSSGAAHG